MISFSRAALAAAILVASFSIAHAGNAPDAGCNFTNTGRVICSGPSKPHKSHIARRHHRRSKSTHVDSNGNRLNTVTVATAAGISITISHELAPRMQGFIADLVARGYKPKRISCLSFSRSHVANSLHYRGEACDFDQRGWGKTARLMYRVADLTKKWGLRNGCSFGDCGHIDSGRITAHRHRAPPSVTVVAERDHDAILR